MKTFKTPKGTELPIMDIKGKDYLQAAPRIFWMKEEHPDWAIETEFLALGEKAAVCKATIRDANGRILAQATSAETLQGFESFVEKAETCAVSRAASFCGYGTLMAQELEEQGKLAEGPIDPKAGMDSFQDDVQTFTPPQGNGSKPSVTADLSGTICPFGSNKGKTFAAVGKTTLANDRTYWQARLREKKEDPKGALKQYLENITIYLGQ